MQVSDTERDQETKWSKVNVSKTTEYDSNQKFNLANCVVHSARVRQFAGSGVARCNVHLFFAFNSINTQPFPYKRVVKPQNVSISDKDQRRVPVRKFTAGVPFSANGE